MSSRSPQRFPHRGARRLSEDDHPPGRGAFPDRRYSQQESVDDGDEYREETGIRGYSPPQFRATPQVGRHRDQRHEWDMNQLRGKLDDMLAAVDEADLQMSGYHNYDEPFENGEEEEESLASYGAGDQPLRGSNRQRPEADDFDPERLRIESGYLMKKSKGFSHRWKQKFAVIDTLRYQLDFYSKEEDFQKERNPETTVELKGANIEPGSLKQNHKSSKVAFPFLITDAFGDTFELNVNDAGEQEVWLESLQYMVEMANSQLQRRKKNLGARGDEMVEDEEEDEARLEEEEERIRDWAQNQTAWGPGLTEAVHGETSTFYIQANDDTGEPIDSSLDVEEIPFQAILSNDDMELELTPEDNGDGTYYVEYTAPSVGTFELQVLYWGCHIFGSPFYPDVLPAPTAPKHCLVEGQGSTIGHIDRKNHFTIVACDQFDAPRGVGGDEFEVTVHGPAIPYDVIDHDNGRYTVSYDVSLTEEDIKAARRGKAPAIEIEVNLRRDDCFYARPIAGSPFCPEIQFTQDILQSVMSPHGSKYTSNVGGERSGTVYTKHAETEASVPVPSAIEDSQVAVQSAPLKSQTPVYARKAADEPLSTNMPNLHSPATNGSLTQENSASYSGGKFENSGPSPSLMQSKYSDRSDLDREREELERQKTEFARQREELERMRQQVEAERESVGLHMSKVSQLGRKVRGDAQKLREQREGFERASQQGFDVRPHREQGTPSPSGRYSNYQARSTEERHEYSPWTAQQHPSKSSEERQQYSAGLDKQHSPRVEGSQMQFSPTARMFESQHSPNVQAFVNPDREQQQLQSSSTRANGYDTNLATSSQNAVSPVGNESEQEGKSPNGMIPGTGGEAPKELFDPQVTQLIDQYKKPLLKLWSYYADNFSGDADDQKRGISIRAWSQICKDHMITPTFVHKKEVKGIFADTAIAHAETEEEYQQLKQNKEAVNDVKLNFAAFTEAVGRLALISLSRPAFANIYPTPREKIAVVLDMWGFGRVQQLNKIKRAHKQKQKREQEND